MALIRAFLTLLSTFLTEIISSRVDGGITTNIPSTLIYRDVGAAQTRDNFCAKIVLRKTAEPTASPRSGSEPTV